MKHGFVRVAAATPFVKVADCEQNADRIIELINIAAEKEIKLIVFPELSVTGYTCGDLFLQDTLLGRAQEEVKRIKEHTKSMDVVVVIGFPYAMNDKLYNTAAVIQRGKVLGLVPKSSIPNYIDFYELRHFTPGFIKPVVVPFLDENIYFGTGILFQCTNMPDFTFGVEIGEDLWIPQSPSISHCTAGAYIIANPSASDVTIGKDSYRRDLVNQQSAKLVCGYINANAGEGESTTDLVFAGHNMIAENGKMLSESSVYENGITQSEVDLSMLKSERRRRNTYFGQVSTEYVVVPFSLCEEDTLSEIPLTRLIASSPFVPTNKEDRESRCRDIINIQVQGLKTRLAHIGTKHAIIGLSGGLDSTLAILIVHKTFERLNLDKKGIIAVTMPCFGTTDRTYRNAIILAECLGVTLKEIPIRDAVELHFRDIGHDKEKHDITYENSQARERTQILMDLANMYNGIVIGTGDLSELALGWATYNGDHMSMYAVNSSVPKTLVQHLVSYSCELATDNKLKAVLQDILDTPVSPELLPPKEGEINQKTEEIVGPYELHDFYLYYIMRFGFEPSKIYRLAKIAFAEKYPDDVLLKWLKIFYRRFFAQQYKRSCLPDGPKVGSVSLSPRGALRMPSDASSAMWMKELEKL